MAALHGKGKGTGTKGNYGTDNYKGGYGKGSINWYELPDRGIGKDCVNYNGLKEDYWSAWGYAGDAWNKFYIG